MSDYRTLGQIMQNLRAAELRTDWLDQLDEVISGHEALVERAEKAERMEQLVNATNDVLRTEKAELRAMLECALEALEYYREQTRPTHRTDAAMVAIHETLERIKP
jgi:hypothetical protein